MRTLNRDRTLFLRKQLRVRNSRRRTSGRIVQGRLVLHPPRHQARREHTHQHCHHDHVQTSSTCGVVVHGSKRAASSMFRDTIAGAPISIMDKIAAFRNSTIGRKRRGHFNIGRMRSAKRIFFLCNYETAAARKWASPATRESNPVRVTSSLHTAGCILRK